MTTFGAGAGKDLSCEEISADLDDYLARKCGEMHNHLTPCSGKDDPCPCSPGTSGSSQVDLVVLIDGSWSMNAVAPVASNAAAAAIEMALHDCPTDLRVTWLVVDHTKPGSDVSGAGGWPGTLFTQSHEQYLIGIGVMGPFFTDQPDSSIGAVPSEQGADAVADLSKYFDWRKDACRAIFYISDTTLDSGWYQDASDVMSTANAIVEANNAGVTVFAHLVKPGTQTNNQVGTENDYQALCSQTGGSLYLGVADEAKYAELLTQAICRACGHKCEVAEIPKLMPCVSVSWGDSKCDCMETDDTEVFCITVCNCYSNVTFANLEIGYVYVTDGAGATVPTLPDGTLSVEAFPRGPICFGDLGPCTEDGANCRSRQFVVIARGAKGGDYQVHLGNICFDVAFHYQEELCFGLALCADR